MKKDNKGFSLVELIIVIAIMAILVGIVGSQVLPYLNKSREAKDQQILSGWVTAALSAYSSNAAECTAERYTLTITPGGTSSISVAAGTDTANGKDYLKSSFDELSGFANQAFASKGYKTITAVVLEITPGASPVVQISALTGATTSISTTELIAK